MTNVYNKPSFRVEKSSSYNSVKITDSGIKIPKSAELLQEVSSTNPDTNAFPSKWGEKKPKQQTKHIVFPKCFFLALNLLMLVAYMWEKHSCTASSQVLQKARKKNSFEDCRLKVA